MKKDLTLVATTAFGLEALAAHELRALGYDDVKVENGKATFQADWSGVARANTWLRTAERVLIKLGEFPARTFDELFDQTKALPWEEFMPEDAMFPVEGKSHLSQLSSVPACQGVVKKAIVEAMKRRYRREVFAETGARYRILVALHKDVATLTLDTTGIGLHKRGYRKLTAPAPLKETMAAALVTLSRWHPDRYLIDPFCGSGTIPIEAGLMARNIAPGLNRDFDASDWRVVPKGVWAEAQQEAQDLVRRDAEIRGIYGSDISAEVLSTARYHAKEAGLENDIFFEKKALKDFQTKKKYGTIITNPPYGERLGDKPEVDQLYRDMGKVFAPLDTWGIYVLTPHVGFERLFDRVAHKKRKLYNGNIRCDLYQYFGKRPPREQVVDETEPVTP
ncbi:class I SAM-dependent RNA methyltransferase [bacterium]|nr:class I SAM-dependent RNA methyltransferase [bacterium]